MNGYVIVLEHDEGDQPPAYWANSATTQNLDEVTFFNDVTSARQTAGTLQTQYTDRSIKVVPATKGIYLKTPTPPTTNVVADT